MKKGLFLMGLMCLCVLAACNSSVDVSVDEENATGADNLYNENSWKDFISDDCQYFNDGCNNCSRTDDGEAVCTKMACDTYSAPHCTDVETEDMRIAKCEEKTKFFLNLGEDAPISFAWEDESEAGASFSRDGVVNYTKIDGSASDSINCFIDMADGSVTIEFTDHEFLGDTPNTTSDDSENVVTE